ncbi:hypothetical protein CAP37_18075 [Hydrogenophaga sp. IBVHS1]|nr:hypothetical protein CAP37_18075 [Hydrogenophaga sp. IBVHS1]
MNFTPLSEDQLRQYIDAESSYTAMEQARQAASEMRGTLFWREDRGHSYLVRANTAAKQTRLGPKSVETEAMYLRFHERKALLSERLTRLKEAVTRHERLNRALRVGRCPNILIAILQRFEQYGLSPHLLTVGTHALYAYEAAAGVRIAPQALATQDVDVLFDTRKRITFFSRLQEADLSFLDVLRKADKTFEVRDDQLQTAVNAHGFEVDVIRREAGDVDPHPLRMSHKDVDLWAVQVSSGSRMLGAKRFSQVVVASNGTMARMHTFAPDAFIKIKRALSTSRSRDPLKKPKDALQANIVDELVREFLIGASGS